MGIFTGVDGTLQDIKHIFPCCDVAHWHDDFINIKNSNILELVHVSVDAVVEGQGLVFAPLNSPNGLLVQLLKSRQIRSVSFFRDDIESVYFLNVCTIFFTDN